MKRKKVYNKDKVRRRNENIFKEYLVLRKEGLGAGEIYDLLSEKVWYCGATRGLLTPDTIKRIIYKQKYMRGEKKRKYKYKRNFPFTFV